MIRDKLVPAAWLLTASVIVGASIGFAARANADAVDDYVADNYTTICETIAQKPYVSTVVAVVEAVAVDTGSAEFAGAAVGTAVRDYCPWNLGTVRRFIDVFAPHPQAVVSGHVGGRI